MAVGHSDEPLSRHEHVCRADNKAGAVPRPRGRRLALARRRACGRCALVPGESQLLYNARSPAGVDQVAQAPRRGAARRLPAQAITRRRVLIRAIPRTRGRVIGAATSTTRVVGDSEPQGIEIHQAALTLAKR